MVWAQQMFLLLVRELFWVLVWASLGLSVYAILRRSWGWMLASAVLYYPFVWYLHHTPRFRGALFLLLFHITAVVALSTRKHRLGLGIIGPRHCITHLDCLTGRFPAISL